MHNIFTESGPLVLLVACVPAGLAGAACFAGAGTGAAWGIGFLFGFLAISYELLTIPSKVKIQGWFSKLMCYTFVKTGIFASFQKNTC